MFDRILVPSDGSDPSVAAAEAATALARRFGATLHVVHVVDTNELPLGADTAVVEALVSRGETVVDGAADAATAAGVDVETAVLRDGAVAHRAIVTYAADHDVDLVVMGTHGRTGLDRFVLGSVAEWTIRLSPAPVLALHGETAFDAAFADVVVPTDGSDAAEHAAGLAVELAAATGAALHVVHVVDLGVVWQDADAGQVLDALTESGREAVERVVERAETAGVEGLEASVLRGAPHRAIVDYAADHDADLVVMGTHGRTGLERYLLGSVTERVVRLSETPVLAVPDAAAGD